MKTWICLCAVLFFNIFAHADDLPSWASMEFTYKTGGEAAACYESKSTAFFEVYRLADIYANSEDESERQKIWEKLVEYDQVSPVAQYILLLFHDFALSYESLSYNLEFTGEYPEFAFAIIAELFRQDLLSDEAPEYDLAGEQVYPVQYIDNFKDYICELGHRGCFDMSDIFEIDCFEEHVQYMIFQ